MADTPSTPNSAQSVAVSADNVNVIVHMCALMAGANESESFLCLNSKKQSALWFRPASGQKMTMDLAGIVHELHAVVLNRAVEPLTVQLYSDGLSARKWCLALASPRLKDFWHIQSFEANKKNWLHITKVGSLARAKQEKSVLEKALKKHGLL